MQQILYCLPAAKSKACEQQAAISLHTPSCQGDKLPSGRKNPTRRHATNQPVHVRARHRRFRNFGSVELSLLPQNLKVVTAKKFEIRTDQELLTGNTTTMPPLPMPAYPFLDSQNDNELVTESVKELERILQSEFYSCGSSGGKDLLDLAATSWGLSIQLRLEFFIVAKIRHKVVHERGYQLTNKTKERFIQAFVRSVREAEAIQGRRRLPRAATAAADNAEARREKRSRFEVSVQDIISTLYRLYSAASVMSRCRHTHDDDDI